eukprot:NODE_851_length_3703_cov_0.692564.p2 type:complete len:181 gc:universal NODE_851_length_3703_cov_0.692564:2000-2542(+)
MLNPNELAELITNNKNNYDWFESHAFESKADELQSRYEKSKHILDKQDTRIYESTNRPILVAELQDTFDIISKFIKESDYIKKEDMEGLERELEAVENWYIEKSREQKELSPQQDSVLTCKDLELKSNQLLKLYYPLRKRPKPKIEVKPAESEEPVLEKEDEEETEKEKVAQKENEKEEL